MNSTCNHNNNNASKHDNSSCYQEEEDDLLLFSSFLECNNVNAPLLDHQLDDMCLTNNQENKKRPIDEMSIMTIDDDDVSRIQVDEDDLLLLSLSTPFTPEIFHDDEVLGSSSNDNDNNTSCKNNNQAVVENRKRRRVSTHQRVASIISIDDVHTAIRALDYDHQEQPSPPKDPMSQERALLLESILPLAGQFLTTKDLMSMQGVNRTWYNAIQHHCNDDFLPCWKQVLENTYAEHSSGILETAERLFHQGRQGQQDTPSSSSLSSSFAYMDFVKTLEMSTPSIRRVQERKQKQETVPEPSSSHSQNKILQPQNCFAVIDFCKSNSNKATGQDGKVSVGSVPLTDIKTMLGSRNAIQVQPGSVRFQIPNPLYQRQDHDTEEDDDNIECDSSLLSVPSSPPSFAELYKRRWDAWVKDGTEIELEHCPPYAAFRHYVSDLRIRTTMYRKSSEGEGQEKIEWVRLSDGSHDFLDFFDDYSNIETFFSSWEENDWERGIPMQQGNKKNADTTTNNMASGLCAVNYKIHSTSFRIVNIPKFDKEKEMGADGFIDNEEVSEEEGDQEPADDFVNDTEGATTYRWLNDMRYKLGPSYTPTKIHTEELSKIPYFVYELEHINVSLTHRRNGDDENDEKNDPMQDRPFETMEDMLNVVDQLQWMH